MLVDFICTANSYRSRLAEAILNSKKLSPMKVLSSGITADLNNWVRLVGIAPDY